MKRSNSLFQSLLIAFAILNMAMLLLFFILFSQSNRGIKSQLEQNTEVNLEQSSNIVSFITEYIQSTVGAVSSDHSVMTLSRARRIDGININTGIMNFNRIRLSFPAVYSLYLYNNVNNVVFASGANEFSGIQELSSFADKESILQVLDKDSSIRKLVPYGRKIPLTLPNGDRTDVPVYTFYSYVTYPNKKVGDLIVINIEAEWINNFVSQFNQGYSNIYVVSNENEIFGQRSIGLETRAVLDALLEQLPRNKEQDAFLAEVGGVKYFVAYRPPKDWRFKDWRFLYVADYDLLTRPLKTMQFITLGISLILVFGSCLLSYLYSKKHILKPVSNLYNRISYLEHSAEEQLGASKHLLIKSLLFGNFEQSESELLKKIAEHKLSLDLFKKQFVFLILYKGTAANSLDGQRDLLKSQWKSIKRIYQKEGASIEAISINKGRIVVLYQDNRLELQNFIERSVLLREESLSKSGLEATVILSSEGKGFRDLPFLYSEVIEAREYLYLTRNTSVLLCRDIDHTVDREIHFSIENEKKLLSAIFCGNKELSQEILDRMNSEMRQSDPMAIRTYLVHLVYEIIFKLKKESVTSGIVDYEDILLQLQTCEYFEESMNIIKELIAVIMDSIQKKKRIKTDEFAEKVKELIEMNYSDQNFCMDVLSRELQMSSAYAGKVFHNAFDKYFTEYLRDYRLEQSCVLLKETEDNACDVAGKVGFGSSTYYFKLFKERYNLTPKMYREHNNK